MERIIVQSGLYIAIILPFLALACLITKRIDITLMLVFCFVIFIDNFCLSYIPHLIGVSQKWNWLGKISEIAFGTIFLFSFKRISLREYGISTVNGNSLAPTIIAFLSIGILLNGLQYLVDGFRGIDLETILFQASMPGLSEELIYRGILLGILNKCFGKNMSFLGVKIGWGSIITSLLFGLVHGLLINKHLSPMFNIAALIVTGLMGFIFAWVTERSNSLLPSILGHNFINTLGSL